MVRYLKGVALLAGLLLAGCGGDSSDDPVTGSQTISIPFQARAGTTDIACDAALQALDSVGTDASLRAFAFYVHDIRLVTDEGQELPVVLDDSDWQAEGVALLDFQDKDSDCSGVAKPVNDTVTGRVAGASGKVIAGLRFRIGIPADLNHEDPASAPSPLNRIDLQWNWQAGHKFMRLDMAPVGGVTKPDTSVVEKWNFHLGSTGCTGDPTLGETVTCTAPNRPEIELDGYGLNARAVRIDYAALVAAATLTQDDGGAPGCMSGANDPECADVFGELGLGINGNADPVPGQTVFSLVTLP